MNKQQQIAAANQGLQNAIGHLLDNAAKLNASVNQVVYEFHKFGALLVSLAPAPPEPVPEPVPEPLQIIETLRPEFQEAIYVPEGTPIFDYLKKYGKLVNPSVTVYFSGYGGKLSIGDGYNVNGCISGDRINLQIIGLTGSNGVVPSLEIVHLGNKYGFVEYLEIQDADIYDHGDSFIIRQTGRVGTVVFNGWRWNASKPAGQYVTSGISMDHGWDTLIFANERPAEIFFREHDRYLKGGGPVYIFKNASEGMNRTAEQIRPHKAYQDSGAAAQPATPGIVGDIHILDNITTHPKEHPLPPSGGSLHTVWSCPDNTVYVERNTELGGRYGFFAAVGQATNRAYVNERGYQIFQVMFEDNTSISEINDRVPVEFSSVEQVYIGDNVISTNQEFDIILGSKFAFQSHENWQPKEVYILRSAMEKHQYRIGRYSPSEDRVVEAEEGYHYTLVENPLQW